MIQINGDVPLKPGDNSPDGRIFSRMLSASDIECVRGTRRLFAGVSFSLARGECQI